MGLDASILQGIKPLSIAGPMDNYKDLLTLKDLMRQSQAGELQMQDAQEARQQKLTLADLYKNATSPDGKLNRESLFTGAAQRGLGAQIPGMQKTFNENDKAQREAEKAQFDSVIQKLDLGARFLASAKDQGSYDASRQSAQASGLDVSRLPPQFDPAFVETKLNESLDAKTRLEQKWKEKQYTTPDANAVLSAGSAALGREQQERNAVRTDDRAREFNATKIEENRLKQTEGKPLNDSQSKALLFGSRMREADKVLATLESEGTSASYGQNLPLVGGVVTALSSANQQMLKQAKTDFMTAVLRRESGAAISSGEFETADKQYFPQAGDSPEVRKQKAANRQLAIDGVLMEVPQQHRDSLKAKPAATGKTITRTGTINGRKVVQYSDGSADYAN